MMKEKPFENTDAVEGHGCIVCGKVYNMLVIYDPDGKLVACTVTSPGGRVVRDIDRPLVACKKHSETVIETALTKHYPGRAIEEPEDD
jgi:hypothetical protein